VNSKRTVVVYLSHTTQKTTSQRNENKLEKPQKQHTEKKKQTTRGGLKEEIDDYGALGVTRHRRLSRARRRIEAARRISHLATVVIQARSTVTFRRWKTARSVRVRAAAFKSIARAPARASAGTFVQALRRRSATAIRRRPRNPRFDEGVNRLLAALRRPKRAPTSILPGFTRGKLRGSIDRSARASSSRCAVRRLGGLGRARRFRAAPRTERRRP